MREAGSIAGARVSGVANGGEDAVEKGDDGDGELCSPLPYLADGRIFFRSVFSVVGIVGGTESVDGIGGLCPYPDVTLPFCVGNGGHWIFYALLVVPWCEGDVWDPGGGFVFLESFLPMGCVLAFGNDLVWLGNSQIYGQRALQCKNGHTLLTNFLKASSQPSTIYVKVCALLVRGLEKAKPASKSTTRFGQSSAPCRASAY
ncbi:hypothetical protein SUGI_0242260 [Cryptomeria japonica]|nr:hypothetical protein SUGI_0242260 [Cryptomeria japonica]